jgi:hypothetical protein
MKLAALAVLLASAVKAQYLLCTFPGVWRDYETEIVTTWTSIKEAIPRLVDTRLARQYQGHPGCRETTIYPLRVSPSTNFRCYK